MMLPVKKKYIDRHNVLASLYEKYVEFDHPNAEHLDAMIAFSELALRAKITDNELRKELDYLSSESELIDYEHNHSSYYIITKKGKASVADRKYVNLGIEEFWNDIKNYIAVVALVISIFTIFWNIHNGNEIDKLKNRIEKIEKK